MLREPQFLRFLPAQRPAVFLIPLATLLYVACGDIGAIVKEPCWDDIPLVLIVTILGFMLTVSTGVVLQSLLGVPMKGNAAVDETKDLGWFPLFFVQVFGEELFKTSILLGCLVLAFQKTSRCKASVAIASTVTLLVFGVAHLASTTATAMISL